MGLIETTQIKYSPEQKLIQRKNARKRAVEGYLSVKAGEIKADIPFGEWSAYQAAKDLGIMDKLVRGAKV